MTLADACERLLEIYLVNAEQFCCYAREKLCAFDTCILKRAPLFRLECIDLLADHRTYALRSSKIHFGERSREGPAAIALRQIAALTEILQKVGDKKRVTFSLLVYECSKIAGKVVWRERRIDVHRDVLSIPRVEGDFVAEIVNLHLRFVTLEWMAAALDVFRTKRSGNQQTLRADALREMTQKIDARRIRPVQVFQ